MDEDMQRGRPGREPLLDEQHVEALRAITREGVPRRRFTRTNLCAVWRILSSTVVRGDEPKATIKLSQVALLTPAIISALAAAANAAPTADNHHVVRLENRGDALLLWASRDFVAAGATRRVLGLLSVGTVAENLVRRGNTLGLHLVPKWVPEVDQPDLLAHFAIQPIPDGQIADDPLERAIESRHSNRRLRFRGPVLPDSIRQELSAHSRDIPGTCIEWLDGPGRRSAALRLIRRAETERFRNPYLHRELFDSIRFDVGWSSTAPEGLPPGSLELPWVERPAFSMLRHWAIQRASNLLGAHRFVGWRGGDLPCRLAAHLCAIVAVGQTEPAIIGAGRLLQRVWLHATELGLGFQVFAAAPVYALPGSTAIDPGLRSELATGWSGLCAAGMQPLVVFRMGYASPPTVRAGRPDPSTLLRA